jgi:hypothetical protein
MKKAKPTFGHSKFDYRLAAIFRRAVKEFEVADADKERADREYKTGKLPPEAVFAALERRTETGVILLMTAGALLEQFIYSYAVTFLEAESFEEHLGKTQTLTKWLLLPKLCENKEVSEDDPAINNLRELIKARNAVVHPKQKELGSKKVPTEIARFLSACRNAATTVDGLVEILKSPAPKA